MTTLQLNNTKITSKNINDCICYDTLYLPYELQIEGRDYVLRFEEENNFENTNFDSFLNDLKFAINVSVSDGWKGMENHLRLNGWGNIRFVGLMKTEDFLTKTDADIMVFLNEELY